MARKALLQSGCYRMNFELSPNQKVWWISYFQFCRKVLIKPLKFYVIPSEFCQSCLRQEDNQSSHLPLSPTELERVMFSNLQQLINNLMKALHYDKGRLRMNSNGLHHQNVTSKFHNSYLSTIYHWWETGLHLLRNFGEGKIKETLKQFITESCEWNSF